MHDYRGAHRESKLIDRLVPDLVSQSSICSIQGGLIFARSEAAT
jgi:hypothetical protein